MAASAGAACHADGVDLSTVLQAMKVPVHEAMGTVRFSVGRSTTEAEVDEAAEIVAGAVERLRGQVEVPAAGAEEAGPVRLTRFTHGLGCACKLRPQELESVLKSLPPITDPRVLVGIATADDAAVYRLTDDLALVQTVDFFTPICDDPADFGAISAANSLSDIYAMGATPRLALSVVGFPSKRLPLEVLERILHGAADGGPGGGHRHRGRPHRRGPRAEVRPRGHRDGSPGPDPHELRCRPRRRALPDQAHWHRDHRHRGQAGPGSARGPRRGHRVDAAAQPRRR